MPKIIVLRFPAFAGSHFIGNCLALHKRILHMDYDHARNKMLGKHTRLQSFAVSMMPALRTQMMDSHFEYNTFNGVTGYKNDLWNKVMDQDYFTPVVENIHDRSSYRTEVTDFDKDGELDKVHIRSINTKWLMESRNQEDWSMETIEGVDTIDFDMGTILHTEQFYKEITKVTDYLQFEPIDKEQLNTMLLVWIKGIKIVSDSGYIRTTGNNINIEDLMKKIKPRSADNT